MSVNKKFGQLLLVMVAGGMGGVSAQTTPAQTPIVTMPVPPADVKIETVSLAPGIYMLIGRGGNVGLTVGVDGAAIIDDQFADMAPKIRAAVAMLSDQPVKFVINTHLHGDHTGGNDAFGKSGAVIIAQENVQAARDRAGESFDQRAHRSTRARGAAGRHVRRLGHAALQR